MTTFDDYQAAAAQTAIYPTEGLLGILYTGLGLSNEAGEVAGKVKKMLRDEGAVLTPQRREQIAAEIGDVLWYCAMLAYELGVPLGEIAESNIAKLADRAERNVIGGDGDKR
jgi:NTP pyrophosphatase (non-canonical NTP hydrolase)